MCLARAAGLVGPGTQALAQDYPTKTVSLIVPFPPGGRTDLTAGPLAQYLKAELGQPVVVINKPGASGVLGAKEVAQRDARRLHARPVLDRLSDRAVHGSDADRCRRSTSSLHSVNIDPAADRGPDDTRLGHARATC